MLRLPHGLARSRLLRLQGGDRVCHPLDLGAVLPLVRLLPRACDPRLALLGLCGLCRGGLLPVNGELVGLGRKLATEVTELVTELPCSLVG